MKFALPLLAAAAAGLALPAFAQDAAPAPAPAAEQGAKEAKQAEKICRSVALNPDRRRKERLCLTAAEWRELNNPR